MMSDDILRQLKQQCFDPIDAELIRILRSTPSTWTKWDRDAGETETRATSVLIASGLLRWRTTGCVELPRSNFRSERMTYQGKGYDMEAKRGLQQAVLHRAIIHTGLAGERELDPGARWISERDEIQISSLGEKILHWAKIEGEEWLLERCRQPHKADLEYVPKPSPDGTSTAVAIANAAAAIGDIHVRPVVNVQVVAATPEPKNQETPASATVTEGETSDEASQRQYVTLDQIAGIVGLSKRTAERWKAAKKDPLPLPDIDGGGGKADRWQWNRVRPWLEKKSNRQLPPVYPYIR